MQEAGIIILCYLIGSIPFSYLFGRIFAGVDIRSRGSGNVGATNVLRTMGVGAGLGALAADGLKGVLVAWIGQLAGGPVLVAVCCGLAIVGHCYPIFLRFRGGKGVATAAGIMLFLMPKIFLILLFVFVAVVIITRYVSMASLVAAVLFPLLAISFSQSIPYILLSTLMAVMVVYRHRENIRRLRNGTESKLGDKA